MKRAKIIVIEGTDGSGKETQSKKIKEYYISKGLNVKSFSFPNLISTNSFGIFNIAFVSESQLSEKLLQTHLIKELYSILDEESNLLILANLGKSNSYKDVMDFLQAK